MPTVVEFTDPLRAIYLNVPRAGPGVCAICHSQPGEGWSICYSCKTATEQVSQPLPLIVPISLATISEPGVSGQLYYTLRTYKADNITASVRDTLGLTIAAVVGRFLHDHTACIEVAAGCTWDAVTIVPSTRNRVEPHPLAAAIGRLPKTGMRYADFLQANATWAGQQREASDQRFTVTCDVRGVSILIIDDTFTTGSRVQSAASALSLAGARVIAAVPIARIVNAEYAPDVLTHARGAPYDFRRCCLD